MHGLQHFTPMAAFSVAHVLYNYYMQIGCIWLSFKTNDLKEDKQWLFANEPTQKLTEFQCVNVAWNRKITVNFRTCWKLCILYDGVRIKQ